VDWEGIIDWLNQQTPLGLTLAQILSMVVIGSMAVILERLVTRRLMRYTEQARFERNVSNNLILTFRLLVLLGASVAIVRVGGLDTQWFLAFSALGGAALGFASTQTIGNFIAGLYLLGTRPFKVGDYVRLGTVEGIIQEITINYTKVLTMGNNTVSIGNLQILQRDMVNFVYEDYATNLYCYTFEIGLDHSVSAEKMARVFEQVFQQYDNLPKKPNYVLLRSGAFDRVYMVYLYVKDPEEIFTLRPRITEEVFKLWDKQKQA
jgi:small-conductance mechanosensitive channel